MTHENHSVPQSRGASAARAFWTAFVAGAVLLASFALVTDISREIGAGVLALSIAVFAFIFLSNEINMNQPATMQDREANCELTQYERTRLDSFRALSFLIVAMVIGIGVILAFAIGLASDAGEFLHIAAVSSMIAGASFTSGAMLGFLFGIPRTSLDSDLNGEGRPFPESEQRSVPSRYRANTNLEQISDWLTKILVGVGLTQISELPGAVNDLAEFLIRGMPDQNATFEVFSISVVGYFVICGFLFSYLWARLFMGSMLHYADVSLRQEVQNIARKQEQAEQQEKNDLRARELVQKQLERSGADAKVPQEELTEALRKARPAVRLELFETTREKRRQFWREETPRPDKIARTIPIFEALVAADPSGVKHRAYGEIGFALKDLELARRHQALPDTGWMFDDGWNRAAGALSNAIQVRNDQGEDIGHLYEANRAICYIVMDPDFRQDQPTSDPQSFQRIVDDLMWAIAERHDWIFKHDLRNPEWMNEYQITQAWLRLNEDQLPPELKAQIRTEEQAARGIDPHMDD